MKILDCNFDGYKNLNCFEFKPHQKMNILYGANAQGKTNFLDAVNLFSGSYRFKKESRLINFNRQFAKLKIDYEVENETISSAINLAEKSCFSINGIKLKSLSEFYGKFIVVYFNPLSLQDLFTNPSKRRNYFDDAICQIKPSYGEYLKYYKRALFQRNSLLKTRNYGFIENLKSWNIQIAKFGTIISIARQNYLNKISKLLNNIYSSLCFEDEILQIKYSSTIFDFEVDELYDEKKFNIYITKLSKTQRKDIEFHTTSVGIHRDDFIFEINGLNLQNYGSQGQKRFCAIALKLVQAKLLSVVYSTEPVILLDDVMSELDSMRQKYLLNNIQNNQVFLTCCDFSNIEHLKFGKILYIKNGGIKSSKSI